MSNGKPYTPRPVLKLAELQIEVALWHRKNFPNAVPHQPLLGIVEEVGELFLAHFRALGWISEAVGRLSHAHLKAEQQVRTDEDHEAAKRDAVGDIAIFLINYCELNGIDFEATLLETWNEVRKRDWQADPVKGSP